LAGRQTCKSAWNAIQLLENHWQTGRFAATRAILGSGAKATHHGKAARMKASPKSDFLHRELSPALGLAVRAQILGIAKTQDGVKNKREKNQAQGESNSLAKIPGKVDHDHDGNDDIYDWNEIQQKPP
jgi:hypothetical protein